MADDLAVWVNLKLKPAQAAQVKAAFKNVDAYADKLSARVNRAFGGKGGGAGGAYGGIQAPDIAGGFKATNLAGDLAPAALAFGAVAAGAATAAVAVEKMVGTMIDLGKAASPAAFQKLQVAMDDVTAVAGRVFVPVVELLADQMRMWGDFLASVLPSAAEVRDAFSFFKPYLAEVRSALQDLAPVIKEFIKNGLYAFAEAIKAASLVVRAPIAFLKGLGVLNGQGGALSSSKGASFQPAQITDISSFLNRQYTSAFSTGVQGGVSVEGNIQKIATDVDRIRQWVVDRAEIAGAGAQGLAEGASNIADAVGEAVRGALLGAGDPFGVGRAIGGLLR